MYLGEISKEKRDELASAVEKMSGAASAVEEYLGLGSAEESMFYQVLDSLQAMVDEYDGFQDGYADKEPSGEGMAYDLAYADGAALRIEEEQGC